MTMLGASAKYLTVLQEREASPGQSFDALILHFVN